MKRVIFCRISDPYERRRAGSFSLAWVHQGYGGSQVKPPGGPVADSKALSVGSVIGMMMAISILTISLFT